MVAVLAATLSAASYVSSSPSVAPAATSVPGTTAPTTGAAPGGFTALTPTRLLDTRIGLGAPMHPVAAGGTVHLQVAGQGGVPATGVSAVALNVTVTAPTAAGLVTVYPGGTTRPLTSSLNYRPGQTVANLVIAQLGTDGTVSLSTTSAGTTQLVADVSGYYRSGPADRGGYVPVTPQRLLDTRTGLGAAKSAVLARTAIAVEVLGTGGVPATGVSAVVLNVTVTVPTAFGVVTVYPQGTNPPLASNLNHSAGQTVANLVVVPPGAHGNVDLLNNSPGSAQLVVDVAGYFSSGVSYGPAAAGGFTPLTATRVLDTRIGVGGPQRAVAPGGVIALQVAGRADVPTYGTAAVVLNLTVTAPTRAGFVTVYPGGIPQPSTSNLNYVAGQTVANLVVVQVGVDGTVNLVNRSSGSTHLVVDVAGYIATDDPPAPLTWSEGTVIDPRQGTVTAVSCVTTSRCMAVDRAGAAFVYTSGAWSPATHVPSSSFETISCPTTTFCAAAGEYGTANTFDGTTWTSAVQLTGAQIVSLSCSSATFCIAVDTAGQTYRYGGTSWSGPVTASAIPLAAVSCASPSMCVALDYQGHAIRYDGAGWSTPTSVFSTQNSIASVDCPTQTFCVAVSHGEAATYGGATWSPSTTPGPLLSHVSCSTAASCVATTSDGSATWTLTGGTTWASAATGGPGAPSSLSCVTSTFCLAVGGAGATDPTGVSSVFGGAAWSPPTRFDLKSTGFLTDASCPTTAFCAAVDLDGLATTFDGTTWSIPEQVDVAASSGTEALAAVSCPTRTFCMAVSNRRSTFAYDGTSWRAAGTADSSDGLKSVSCASPTFCIALDYTSHAFHYDGASWSTGTLINALGYGFASVSCPSTTFCAATNGGRSVMTYDGASWTSVVPSGGQQLITVSCGAPDDCTMVDGNSRVLRLAGSSWSPPAPVAGSTGVDSMSCVALAACQAVDEVGNAFPIVGGVGGAFTPTGLFMPTAMSCANATFCVALDRLGVAVLGS